MANWMTAMMMPVTINSEMSEFVIGKPPSEKSCTGALVSPSTPASWANIGWMKKLIFTSKIGGVHHCGKEILGKNKIGESFTHVR